MIDTEFLQAVAENYANVHIVDPTIVATVHLEDEEDQMFWDEQLQKIHPGKYNYIYRSKAHSDSARESSGCEQCLRYKDYLNRWFFICIDSDMRLLTGERSLDAQHYIIQTHTYSWENHCCEMHNLTRRVNDYIDGFNFTEFLSLFSSIVYTPLLYLLHCTESGDRQWDMAKFRQCIPGQVKREELKENGKAILQSTSLKFREELDKLQLPDVTLKDLQEKYNQRGLTQENAYLHVRGHSVYNLVTYIGKLLERGKPFQFQDDILNDVSHLDGYTEIDNVYSDIRYILEQS